MIDTVMRAAVLRQRGRAGLSVCDFPRPVSAEGEALLKVSAAGLNRVDLYMRDNGAGITHELPLVLGVEAAGVVVAASGLRPGQKAVLYSNAYVAPAGIAALATSRSACAHA